MPQVIISDTKEAADKPDDELEGTAYDRLIEDLYMTVPEDEPTEE